jgi:lipopolysaccharide assembly outer membrane protein LptD (OstA)
MKRLFAAALLGTMLAAAPKSAAAPVGAWNLVTQQLNANVQSGAFSAPGPVTMTRADGSKVVADRATGNYKTKQAQLFGHVRVDDRSGTFGLKSASGDHRGPALLTADELRIDDRSHVYDALGNVHYDQGTTTADADAAHLNDVTHRLVLTGKVHVVEGDRLLDAQTAVYNTATGAGEANGDVTMIFPGGFITLATPKPIVIKRPKIP